MSIFNITAIAVISATVHQRVKCNVYGYKINQSISIILLNVLVTLYMYL
jgi:hypothetical protein